MKIFYYWCYTTSCRSYDSDDTGVWLYYSSGDL